MNPERPSASPPDEDNSRPNSIIPPDSKRIDYKGLAKRIHTVYSDPRWEEWDADHPQPDQERPPHWFDERDTQAKEADEAEDRQEKVAYGDKVAEEYAQETASKTSGKQADEVRRIWREYAAAGYKNPDAASTAGPGATAYLSPQERMQANRNRRGEYVNPASVQGEILRRIKLRAVYAEIDLLADTAYGDVNVDVLERAPMTARAATKLKITKFLGKKMMGKQTFTAAEYMDGEDNETVDPTPLVSVDQVEGWLIPRRIPTGRTTPEGFPIYERDRSVPGVDKAVNLVIDIHGRSWNQGRIADPSPDSVLTVGVTDDWRKGDRIIDTYSLKDLQQVKKAVRAIRENPLWPIPEDNQEEGGNGPETGPIGPTGPDNPDDTPTTPTGTPGGPTPPPSGPGGAGAWNPGTVFTPSQRVGSNEQQGTPQSPPSTPSGATAASARTGTPVGSRQFAPEGDDAPTPLRHPRAKRGEAVQEDEPLDPNIRARYSDHFEADNLRSLHDEIAQRVRLEIDTREQASGVDQLPREETQRIREEVPMQVARERLGKDAPEEAVRAVARASMK